MSEKITQAPEAPEEPKSNKISNETIGCPYTGTFTLKDTAKMMFDPNYKVRFLAEYIQLKIRYEKLKHLLNKMDAFRYKFKPNRIRPSEELEEFIRWLGFTPSCSKEILEEQRHQMELLLHTLELRAVIEGIDLTKVTIEL